MSNHSMSSKAGSSPNNAAPHSLPGADDIFRQQLPNGLVVLARSNFNSPSVVVSGGLMGGSLFDEDEKLGLADFVASAMMRGTRRRSFQEIYETLESSGASLNFSGGTHSIGFNGRALVEDLDMLLELLVEVLQVPVFPIEQVERLRAQLLTGLAIRSQDTGDMASLAFDELVYAGHPYRRPEDGYPETVQAIQREDLVDFHRQVYGPQGGILAIVGAVEPQMVMDRVMQALGSWSNAAQRLPAALPPVQPLPASATRKVTIAGKSQSDVVMGAAGPSRMAADFLPASVGNSILGQFGMMGRIGDVVRERAGLAYYASSSLAGGIGPGPWSISAGVDPANVEKAVDLIRKEIARFVHEPVTDEELADVKANFVGRLPLSLESNSGVAAALINLERFQLGLDYYRDYPGKVQAVSVAEVQAAAAHYLDPDRLAVGVAGS